MVQPKLRRAIEDASGEPAERSDIEVIKQSVEAIRLRQLADALPAYVSYVDADQRYVFLNRAYAENFARPAAELTGRTVEEVIGPDNYEGVRPQLEAALRGIASRSEKLLRLPDGRVRVVEASWVPDRRGDGTIAGCFVMVIDITERKQAEDLTRRVLDNLFTFVGILELDGTLTEVNAAPLEVSDLGLADVIGRKFWDTHWWSYSAKVQARLREACARAAAGETVRYDATIRTRGDEPMIIDFQLAPLRDPDGRITHLIPSAVDVTHRVLAEQRVRESEERLRLAKDAAGLGIHDYDMHAGVIRWDERVRELWGVGRAEPITRELFMAGVHPDDRADVDLAVERALDPAYGGYYRLEHRVISRADAQVRWVAISGKTTFVDGQPVRAVGTVLDITARKQAEEELRFSREQLRESDRRKDEFLAMLGHELRNPLAAICSATELLRAYKGEDRRLARIADVLDRQSNHMVRLVDGLLEVSRIARGKIDLEWSVVDVCAVLGDVLDDRKEQLERSGLELDARLPGDPLWVRGDDVRLVQIFDNLIGNALKFTPAPGRIRVEARRCEDNIVVVIADTGVGIRPDMLEAIFEPFLQDQHDRARLASGLGIGLALVRGLVELHRGSIVARSDGPGMGAEFEVRLPAFDPASS